MKEIADEQEGPAGPSFMGGSCVRRIFRVASQQTGLFERKAPTASRERRSVTESDLPGLSDVMDAEDASYQRVTPS